MSPKLNRAGKSGGRSIPALLSHVLVAFTIEFDNEFEHRTPHVTTAGGTSAIGFGVWLTSMVMYSNALRLLPDEGVTVRELEHLARTPSVQLPGLQRWGYITMSPDPQDKRPKPPQRDWIVRSTIKGRMARQMWAALFGETEQRWRRRFGEEAIDSLRSALVAIVSRFEIALPEYLPIVGFGLKTAVNPEAVLREDWKREPSADSFTLPALLAKTLLAFTLEFERESAISLPICTNVLCVLGGEPVEGAPIKVGEIPRIAGVSIESVRMATGFLKARGYVRIEADPAIGRGKVIWLTQKGEIARECYLLKVEEIEERWKVRFGEDAMSRVRNALEPIAMSPLLMDGVRPYPDGWRAMRLRPETLPDHPMVLHRGGYPDGS